jgi:hypothetical protein
MWKRLNLGAHECDAPPYAIVQACAAVDCQTPEDVRWCRIRGLPGLPRHWRGVPGAGRPDVRRCLCGHGFPLLYRCTFTFETDVQVSYYLGQCRRCRTIYWAEAVPSRAPAPCPTEAVARRGGGR